MPKLFYLYMLDFPNGKKYIGYSKHPRQRLAEHHGRSNCTYVQNAIRKYGSPKQRILCVGPHDYIVTLEEKAIASFQTQNRQFGYNIGAGGKTSPALVKEVAEKIRATLMGRKQSAEHVANMRAATKGIKKSAEWRAKIGDANRGRIFTPAMRDNARAAAVRRLTPEVRAKIAATLIGRKASPELRAKLSAAHKGARPKFSPEARAKLIHANKARIWTSESRAKLSASLRAHQSARRASQRQS